VNSEQRDLPVAASIGACAAEWPDAQRLLAEADRRMYSMKQAHHAEAEARQENKAHGAKAR
jgi:GGDEF domain-containing protein